MNNNLPLDLQHPGGFVEEYMNFVNETAVCEQPLFALASALSLAGTLYGQHVQTEDGQRTNLFCMTRNCRITNTHFRNLCKSRLQSAQQFCL